MMTTPPKLLTALWTALAALLLLAPRVCAADEAAAKTIDQTLDEWFGHVTKYFVDTVFFSVKINGTDLLLVVVWLAMAGIVLTVAFGFINLRAFGLALRTVRGKYSQPGDPGEVSHFQALSAAVSGTVGLGNIAGVAIGIQFGGPGVAFWLFLSGFLGMSTKFAECTLGVRYREIDAEGKVHGGPMYYLRKGFAERGHRRLGMVMAGFFALMCVFASFGGGNVFQVNQVAAQLVNVTGGADSVFNGRQWMFGVMLAGLTALVIMGGIKGIARVTGKLVPAMCLLYVLAAITVLVTNAAEIPGALRTIVTEAFEPRAAVAGGALSAFIWGMRRATFSNEAGIGSAPIAHSAARTRRPASEGLVALLEPFVDTVLICTLTSLVLVVSMQFDGAGSAFTIHGHPFELGRGDGSTKFGIEMSSLAFETVYGGFKYLLFACVFLFGFSTLITWSYYGMQAWEYLFGVGRTQEWTYKTLFCLIIVAGSSATMTKAVDFSDASLFAMSVPNLIGVYFLLPVVRSELKRFIAFTRRIDAGATIEEADTAE